MRPSLPAKFALIMATVTSLACAPFREPTVTAAAPAKRAVWIWEKDSFALLDNEAFRKEILPSGEGLDSLQRLKSQRKR